MTNNTNLANFCNKVKFKLLITKNSVGNTSIGRKLKKIRTKTVVPVNNSQHFEGVCGVVKSLRVTPILFYGSLLEYARNSGQVTAVDDYDFLLTNQHDLKRIISRAELAGLSVKSVALDANDSIIEISYYYKETSIDFFIGHISKDGVLTHKFANFRQDHGILSGDYNLRVKTYPRQYVITIKNFSAIYDARGFHVPADANAVIEAIYDEEWRTPKSSDFIDYSNYSFIDSAARIVSGRSDLLLKMLNEKYS